MATGTQQFKKIRLSYFRSRGSLPREWRFRDDEGRETYALRVGEGDVPMVLVHGGLDHAGCWSLVAPHLKGPLVMPDRPGCGLGYPIDYRGVDYRGAAARWLLALVDALGVDQVDLVGNSMGGYFSIAFAVAHPDRVRNLILPGCPASLDRQIPLFLRLMGRAIIGPQLAKLTAGDPETTRKKVFKTLVAHPERVPTELLEIGRMNAAMPSSQRCVHTMLRQFTTLWGVRPEVELREDLERLELPTLFLWGDKDQFGSPSIGQELVGRMPNAHLEILEDVGHLPHLDAPERIAQSINAFVQPARSSAPTAAQ